MSAFDAAEQDRLRGEITLLAEKILANPGAGFGITIERTVDRDGLPGPGGLRADVYRSVARAVSAQQSVECEVLDDIGGGVHVVFGRRR